MPRDDVATAKYKVFQVGKPERGVRILLSDIPNEADSKRKIICTLRLEKNELFQNGIVNDGSSCFVTHHQDSRWLADLMNRKDYASGESSGEMRIGVIEFHETEPNTLSIIIPNDNPEYAPFADRLKYFKANKPVFHQKIINAVLYALKDKLGEHWRLKSPKELHESLPNMTLTLGEATRHWRR